MEDAVEVDVDQPLPIGEFDVGEALEPVEAGGVDQNGDRSGLRTDAGERGVDLPAVGDVGLEREVGVGRFEVDGRNPIAVFAQSLDDGKADSGAAAGDNSRSHEATGTGTVSLTKNLPSEYENLTLAL